MGKSKRKSKLTTVQGKSPLVSSSITTNPHKATEAKLDSNNSKKNITTAGSNSSSTQQQQSRYHNEQQKKKKQDLHSGTSGSSRSDNDDDDIVLPKPFPQHLPRPIDDFLRDEDPYRQSFQAAMEGPYEGFVVDTADDLAKMGPETKEKDRDIYTIHEEIIQSSLLGMYQQEYFRTDVTQPFGLGTKCAKTYVTRCLVGKKGTTYKYLGLRMFAHPYDEQLLSNGIEQRNNNNNPYTRTIQSLGLALTQRTKVHLHDLDTKRKQRQRHIAGSTTPTTVSSTIRGRPDFDICLINRMVYSDDLKPVLEPNTLGGCSGGGGIGNSTSHHQEHSSINNNNNNTAKTTVSWHADSSLEHYSTIAVYQTLQKPPPNHDGKGGGQDQETSHVKIKQQPPSKTQPSKMQHKKTIQKRTFNGTTNDQHQWWIALRVAHCVEGPQSIQKKRREWGTTTIDSAVIKETPPIAVSLPSGSAYYLLDDFNHHHQHTVMTTGDINTAGVRYSCTFRLLRDSHNVQDWLIRGKSAISQFHKKGNKLWRSEQLLLTTIETEWIRQFYIQGMKHYELLWYTYWKEPIQELLLIWSQLERRTCQVIDLLRAAAEGKCGIGMMTTNDPTAERPTKADRKARDRRKKALATVQDLLTRGGNNTSTSNCGSTTASERSMSPIMELYGSMAELLEERAEMRELWEKREKDHVFHELPPDCRPMPVPFRFECSMDEPMDGSYGISPLPGIPSKLKELALQLRQLAEAYQNGDRNKLPPSLDDKQEPLSDGSDSDHSKALDWHGWNMASSIFGLELQHPWASWVVDGKKVIETRAYRLPDALIGKKVMIIESTNGKAGVSALDNVIDFSTAKVIGWVVFTKVMVYKTRESFEADETLHLVTPDSGYGWNAGTTLEVFGWVVGQYGRNLSSKSENNGKYVSAIRRMRSLFELKVVEDEFKIKDKNRPGTTTTTTTTNGPGTTKTTTATTTNPRKQNKRNRNHNNNNNKNKGDRADQNGNHGGKRKKRF